MAYFLAFLCAVTAVPIGLSWRGRRRWGARLVRDRAGAGAYREGDAPRQVFRSVPGTITWAAVVSWVWGAVTLGVLVPSGVILCALIVRERGVLPLFALPLGVVVISGLVLGVRLLAAGTMLPLHRPDCDAYARSAALHARWHHCAVWVTFAVVGLTGGLAIAVIVALMLAVPCGIGLGVASTLDDAARTVDRLARL